MKKIIFSIAILIPSFSFAQLADSSKRLVHMQGAYNFRDVGGYKTTDGKEVVWGTVYRSADVSRLTDHDLDTLSARHIHTVIDFRGKKESAAAPDHLLPETKYQLCPAGSDSLPTAAQIKTMIQQGDFVKFYGNTRYLGERYKPLFQELLALPEGQAIMYHCTGGRDRTGMATALFLYALGVPQATIEADFVASNVYLQPMYGRMFKSMEQSTGMSEAAIRKAMELQPAFLQSMFDAIRAKYGTVENFFEKELGIGATELKQLKKKYTKASV
jgi:protein-tyrosine phosphatase